MSEATVYTQGGMQEGISALTRANKELVERLETLKGELRTSLGQWEDNARVTYQQVQDSWDRSAARQGEIIQGMAGTLTNISDGYDATERSNQSRWA